MHESRNRGWDAKTSGNPTIPFGSVSECYIALKTQAKLDAGLGLYGGLIMQ